jgi:hypothetical protein
MSNDDIEAAPVYNETVEPIPQQTHVWYNRFILLGFSVLGTLLLSLVSLIPHSAFQSALKVSLEKVTRCSASYLPYKSNHTD